MPRFRKFVHDTTKLTGAIVIEQTGSDSDPTPTMACHQKPSLDSSREDNFYRRVAVPVAVLCRKKDSVAIFAIVDSMQFWFFSIPTIKSGPLGVVDHPAV